MAKAIGDRYASMGELAAALTDYLQYHLTECDGSGGDRFPCRAVADFKSADSAGWEQLSGRQLLAQLAEDQTVALPRPYSRGSSS